MSIIDRLSRRSLLAAAGGFTVLEVASSLANAQPAAAAAVASEATNDALAEQTVEVLEAAYGKHSRQRRNHSKGLGALGSFVGNPEMARYSRSELFSGKPVEVIARFSIAGGDPVVSDADRSTRGLGLQFRLPNGVLHHITMLNTPMFFAAVPRTFNEKTAALIPDRNTGEPDPHRFRAYLDAHPENAGQATYLKQNNPPPSYAETAYFGIHTFRFIDGEDRITKVKFRFVPRDGEHSLSDAQMQSAPRDFLEAAYAERLTKGPTQ